MNHNCFQSQNGNGLQVNGHWGALESSTEDEEMDMVVNDAVHGHIRIDSTARKIIDTPEFQRLRDIKQCGLCHLVYPSATHTRFEHSIGVYHLTKLMIEELRKTEEGWLTPEESLCLSLAGLCHDLGHGPFSHTWERFVLEATGEKFNHEDMSCEIFDLLIKNNELEGELNKDRRELVKSLIRGKPGSEVQVDTKKMFIFEIVSNGKTGIDVDKWDYLIRDSYHFGVKVDFDYYRLLYGVTIDKGRIQYRDKTFPTVLEMFESRAKMHQKCYQHQVCMTLEKMLLDALIFAKDYPIEGKKGSSWSLSKCHKDPVAFLKVSDYIYYDLKNSVKNELKETREILSRMDRRQFYTTVSRIDVTESESEDLKIKSDLLLEKLEAKFREYQFTKQFSIVDFGKYKDIDNSLFSQKPELPVYEWKNLKEKFKTRLGAFKEKSLVFYIKNQKGKPRGEELSEMHEILKGVFPGKSQ